MEQLAVELGMPQMRQRTASFCNAISIRVCAWIRVVGCGGLLFLLGSFSAQAQKVRLEFELEWQGKPIRLNEPLVGAAVSRMSMSRWDALVSGLGFRREDGTWLDSDRWYGFLSAEKHRLSVDADGLPASSTFTAMRFRIGLPSEIDHRDPATWPAAHPLNPNVCGLHWGWTSGYVFAAVEGHWEGTGSKEKDLGFSYHLAGDADAMWVEIPLTFKGGSATTLRLVIDVDRWLDLGAMLKKASSTHSREGDATAAELKHRLVSAVRLREKFSDVFQSTESLSSKSMPIPIPTRTTAFPIRITERFPKVSLPPDNPLTIEGVALGRRLFGEKRLSKNESQSCASCHEVEKGFGDDHPLALGSEGQVGRRNTMALMNLAWASAYFWDGRAGSLREQALIPIQDPREMNNSLDTVLTRLRQTEGYEAAFEKAFDSRGITAQRIGLAIEQFLITLISQDSKFDRAARKLDTLTPQEQRGLQLFITEHDPAQGLFGADCFHCHGGNLFTNHQFLNNGLEERAGDRGRMEVTGLESDRGRYKVPTLRNVAVSGPYMHDGRFKTLEEVIEHYNGPMHRSTTLDPNLAKHPVQGLNLSAEDKAALVAFLKTLTDDAYCRGR